MNKKPNIILINCDDLGYGDLGCYGSTLNKTPNIDHLAEGGLKFSDFYMASPVCSASRAAMMTGCYPPRVGFGPRPVLFPGADTGLSQNETTLASMLKETGYATKIIGKWHCGDQPEFLPTSHGFDEYLGIPYSNDMGRQVGNDGKAPEKPYPPLPLMRDKNVAEQQPDQRSITERYTLEAEDFIAQKKDQPFFLYLAHMYVHVPLFIPENFLKRSDNGAYGGAVECIDWSTGRIVAQLTRLGLLENTLIIFTSDNGSRAGDEGGSNGPCRGTKGTTWEGGQRVPCIMHWPDRIKAGSESSSITRSIDFLPTLSSLTGSPLPAKPIDGVDVTPIVNDPGADGSNDTMLFYRGAQLEAVRRGPWKLHFYKINEPHDGLYHLKNDVGETHNLRDAHPEIVKELEAFAQDARKDLGDSLQNMEGEGVRSAGHVDNPKPLTVYDQQHPCTIPMYDLADMPTMAG